MSIIMDIKHVLDKPILVASPTIGSDDRKKGSYVYWQLDKVLYCFLYDVIAIKGIKT
jgi:hypothetical protein